MEEYRIVTSNGYHRNSSYTKCNNEEFVNEVTTLNSYSENVDYNISEDQKSSNRTRDCPNIGFTSNTVRKTMATNSNLSQTSMITCPTYANIPFVQIHTTDVLPQKMSFGNVFRRSNSNNNSNINKQEIKSEPIKSESADITIKERLNGTPTPPSRTQPLHNQNDNILPECGMLLNDVQQQQDQEQEQEKLSNQSNNNILNDSDTCLGSQVDIFKCTECPYICLNSLDLDLHMENVHMNGDMDTTINEQQRLQLKCLGCLNVFYAVQCLELHYKMDHLMSSENVQQLIGKYKKNALVLDDNQKSNRIFLKNVKQLCDPLTTTTDTSTTLSSSCKDNSSNDSNNNNTSGNCIEESKNITTKQKISIKSVDVLREPALLQYNDCNMQYNRTLNNSVNMNTHNNNNNNSSSSDNSCSSAKNYLNGFLLPTTTDDINHFEMPFDNDHSKQLYHYNMNSLITTSVATVTTTAITSGVVLPSEIVTTTTTMTTTTTTSKTFESISNNYIHVHDEHLLSTAADMDTNRIATPLKQPKIYVKSVESFNVTSMHNSALLPMSTMPADIDNNYYAINDNILNLNVNNELYGNVDDENGSGNGSNYLHLPITYDPDDVSGDGGCDNNLSLNTNFTSLESPLNTFQLLNNFNNNDSIINSINTNNNSDNETANTNNNNNNNSSNNYMLEASLLNSNPFDYNAISAYAISTQPQVANLPLMDQPSLEEYDVAKVELNTEKLPSQFSFCNETRGTLHLRTVDELNLMNENEVQNLIAPNLENNNNNYNSNNNSSNHQQNNDELINNNNDDGMVIATSTVTVTTIPITSITTSIISNNNATHLTTNSLDAIHILQDTFYPDDSFKFHDLDTQMVNNWSDNYDELAQDISYIIDHNTATATPTASATVTVTASTTTTTTITASATTSTIGTVISTIENDIPDRLSDKHNQSNIENIDARLNTLITIRDIDELNVAVLSSDTLTAIPIISTSNTATRTLTTTSTIANIPTENVKDCKPYQHQDHQQQHHHQSQQQQQQQQQIPPQCTLIPFNDCHSQIELNSPPSHNNNNKGNNIGHSGTVIHDKENVGTIISTTATATATAPIITLNGSKTKLNQSSSLLKLTKDNNNNINEKDVNDVPPLVPVSKSVFHVKGMEERGPHKGYNENVIESIKRLPVPPLIKFSNNSGNKQITKSSTSASSSSSSILLPLSNGPVEKGRIYVANNLMEQPKQETANAKAIKATTAVKTTTMSKAIAGTSIRGRPYGSNRSCVIKNNAQAGQAAQVQIKNNLKCPMKGCTFRFKKPETLEYHKKCHYPSNNHNNQHQHDTSCKSSEINEKHKIMCPECKTLKFTNWNTLHTHLWRQHQIDIELYKCDLCNFKTPIYSRLINTHTKIHLDERNYKCEECSKAFKNAKQLKNHRRWHRMQLTNNNNNIHDNNHSDKRDNNEQSKNRNNKFQDVTMTSKVIHSCPKCGVAYSQLKSLREHYCKIPIGAGGVQLKCDICDKLMSTKASLRLHRLTQHNSGSGNTDNGDCNTYEKRYKCPLCVYTTNDHNAMRRHNMFHEKKAMYQCQYCDYKSVQSAAYQKHIRHKHPEKADTVLYKCLKCNFCTVSRALLITHQSKHSVVVTMAPHADSHADSNVLRDNRNVNEKVQCNNGNNNNENIITQKAEHIDTTSSNTSTNTELFKTKIKVKSNLFNVQQDEDGSLHSLHSFTSLIMNIT